MLSIPKVQYRLAVRSLLSCPRGQFRGISLHSQGPWNVSDDLSVTHANHLEATLRDHLPTLDPSGSPEKHSVMRPGSHFVYFNHSVPESELDVDGYDNLQAPININEKERILLRRWYGGSVEFNIGQELYLGSPATCRETIEEVRAGPRGHRVNVKIARYMQNDDQNDWAIKETRSLIYLGTHSRLLEASKRLVTQRVKPEYTPVFRHELTASRLLLFRYSALTFNAHRIHYDRGYASEREGLADVIVQGPLMVTLLLRWLSDTVLRTSKRRIQQFQYRNIAPLFVDEKLALCATHITDNTMEVWITGNSGHLALSGRLVMS